MSEKMTAFAVVIGIAVSGIVANVGVEKLLSLKGAVVIGIVIAASYILAATIFPSRD